MLEDYPHYKVIVIKNGSSNFHVYGDYTFIANTDETNDLTVKLGGVVRDSIPLKSGKGLMLGNGVEDLYISNSSGSDIIIFVARDIVLSD